MAFIVQKYGGTSVATPERIKAVADWIAQVHSQGHRLVIVVSAMGHTTDELESLAQAVSSRPSIREMDMLMTAGERISMALLSMALADRGIPAISLTGSQSGIVTDRRHQRARILRILGNRIYEGLGAGKVVIVAGFQGVSEDKEITTLGRGGSDTTAVALAAALKADECQIFTDVDGVYSADPRIVPDAVPIREVPYGLMVELAARGAGVLHSRSVLLGRRYELALKVCSSLELPGKVPEGTSIVADGREDDDPASRQGEMRLSKLHQNEEGMKMESGRITAVTADPKKVLYAIRLTRPTVFGALWERLSEVGITPLAPFFRDGEVWFFAEGDLVNECENALRLLQAEGFVDRFSFDRTRVPLSLVGNGLVWDPSILSRCASALNRENIQMIHGVMTGLALTVAVPAERVEDGLRALHSEFVTA